MQVGGVPGRRKQRYFLWTGTVPARWPVTMGFACRLSQVSLPLGRSVGYSCPKMSIRKQIHCNGATQSRQLQKKRQTAGTWTCFLFLEGWGSTNLLNCNTSEPKLTPSVQTANRAKLCYHFPSLFLPETQSQILIRSNVLLLLMGTSC